MTPEQFEEVAANLAAGFYTDAETLRWFVAEAVELRSKNDRLTAELDQLRWGLDELLAKLREDESAVVRARSEWPGE